MQDLNGLVNPKIPSLEEAKKLFCLSLYAMSNCKDRTKAFADRIGIKFDEERIYCVISAFHGPDAEKSLRGWWDEARQKAFDEKLMALLSQEEQKFLLEQKSTG